MPSKADEKLLKRARDRFQQAVDAERDIRMEATKDLRYLAGDQWPAGEKKTREDNGRPALTINKLPQFVDQVVNEQRRNRPGAKVSPVGDGADPDTADICEGLIRHIESASQADVAYDTAFEYSASCSFGYWRYTTEYVDDDTFDQEIRVVPIMDPAAVYLDNGAILPDRSDGRWGFVLTWYTREEYKRRWPASDACGAEFWDLGDNPAPDWIRENGVRVAEYWELETSDEKRHHCSDGVSRKGGEPLPEGVTIEKTRRVERRVVTQYIMNGAEVLETNPWAGKWIPIVPVYGKQLMVDGKLNRFSLIRFARDPQALYNYYKTSQAEAVGLSPKAPFIGYAGQFKSDPGWLTANSIPHPFLEVDPVMIGGQPAPLPQRNQYEPPIQALSVGALQASDDIKATTGLFDPSLGAVKGDQSGEAIRALQSEGNTSNFHLVDNLTRALWHGYRIVLDLLPKIYDAERAIRIIKPDHESELVLINQMFLDKKTGKQKMHNFSLGRYDVVVSVGPGYETRREETRDRLVDLAKADPQSIPQWADLYVKQLDIGPIGDQIADRLTPPQYRDKNDPQQVAQMAQQKLQQSGMMIQQLTETVHSLQNEIDAKARECESRERIAQMQEETKRTLGIAALDSKDGLALLMQEVSAVKHRLDMTHEAAMAETQHEHEAQQAQQAQQVSAQQQGAAQDHQREMQGSDQQHQAAQASQAQDAAAAQQEAAQAAQPEPAE